MNQSPIKSSIQFLTDDNDRLRENLNEMRKEKEEALKLVRKVQGQMKTTQMKFEAIKNQNERYLAEIRRFREGLDQEKRERVRLLTENSELKNVHLRSEAQIATLRAENENLQKQSNRLHKQTEANNLSKVSILKQKQTFSNAIKVLETKLEAAEMEKKFTGDKLRQAEIQLIHCKKELSEMTQKYHNKELGVQAIYRDEAKTKEQLLGEFQNKISDKEQEMKKEIQKYINENIQLRKQLRETRELFKRNQ